MKRNNKRKAFTIVELVIVIAVIAILATVLVPAFGSIIQDAKDSAAKQAAKNAYTQYLVENDGSAPEVMVYKHSNGKVVALENGAASYVYDTEAEFFTAYHLAVFEMTEGILYSVNGEENTDRLLLDGLNVLCLGDSITAGQGLTADARWTNVLASKFDWTLTNKSQGGISLSSYYYTANGKTDVSIAKKAEILKAMTTAPDIIIVWGGHNDTSYTYSPLGTWEDTTTDSFKGALKYIAGLAKEYAPNATLFVLTPLWYSENTSILTVPENTIDNDWMFIDAIYEGSDIYGWIPINMDLCGVSPYNKKEFLHDGVHPNAAGTEKIVEFLSEELASCGQRSKQQTIVLNQSSVSLEVGKSTTIKAVLTPKSGYSTPIFTWTSSDPSVATVNSNGVITTISRGHITITVTADNGVSTTVSVTVA